MTETFPAVVKYAATKRRDVSSFPVASATTPSGSGAHGQFSFLSNTQNNFVTAKAFPAVSFNKFVPFDNGTSGGGVEWLNEEDVAFLFATMTWNVDLLEVLLAKVPSPLNTDNQYHYVDQLRSSEMAGNVDLKTPLEVVFPSLEEAVLMAETRRRAAGGRNRFSGCGQSRRSKRRKVGRSRATQLRLQPAFFYKDIAALNEDDGEDQQEKREEEEEVCSFFFKKNTETKEKFMNNSDDSSAVREKDKTFGTYLTEEEEIDTRRTPCRCLEANDSFCAAARDAVQAKMTAYGKDGDEENTGQKQQPHATMRGFLRLFYQSFLIAVAAQLKHQQNAVDENKFSPDLFSSLEQRAFCVVRRYLAFVKGIFRQYVISGEKEVERRGAQPLLVGDFCCDEQTMKEKWAPVYSQVYIAGREPVCQPLFLEALDVTRVVQCYANPSYRDSEQAATARRRDIASSTLYYWRRLVLLEDSDDAVEDTQNKDVANQLFLCNEEREEAYGIFKKSLSPLMWTEYNAPFGPYKVYVSNLPFSNRCAVKLVLPAEDHESYNLSKHFQEGVFRFLHGTPFFPFDGACYAFDEAMLTSPTATRTRRRRQCSLLHCSAGMHRSSGMGIAYLLWLVALSRGKLPVVRGPTTTITSAAMQEEKPPQQQPVLSYLSAALRQCQPPLNSADNAAANTVATKVLSTAPPPAAAAAGAAEKEKEERKEKDCEKASTKTENVTEGPTRIVERCAEHMHRQRTMAVPIPAVQEQLKLYARYLHLE